MATLEEIRARLQQEDTRRPAGRTSDPLASIKQRLAQGEGVPPIPDPQGLPAGRPRSLPEATGGRAGRGLFEAVGGTVGAAAGTGGGPAGVLGGGMLGAAGGSLAFDNAEDFANFLGIIDKPPATTGERLGSAGEAARMEGLFGGGAAVAGTAFRALKPLVGKALGVRTEEALRLADIAEAQGIGVGAVDIAQGLRGRVLAGTGRVAGIFPYIGGPFRKAAQGKAAQVVRAVDDTLNALAPNAVLANDLGIDMARAAKGASAEFRAVAARNYDELRSLARELPDPKVLDTQKIRDAALDFVQETRRGQIVLQDGDILTGQSADMLDDFLKKLDKLPDRIDFDQQIGLTKNLEEFVSTARAEGFDIKRVVGIKSAIEETIGDLRVPSVEDVGLAQRDAIEEVVAARDAANVFYSKGIVQFQTPTAQRFGRADKNIFKPGFETPGSLNEDELSRVVTNLRSPQAIDDLTNLVGKEKVGKAARLHFENAWEQSIITDSEGVIKGFNWDQFSKAAGLTSSKAVERGAAEKLLKVGGVDPQRVKDLVEVARNIEVPREVSDFIARRAALGGAGAALGGATVTTLIKGSAVKSLGVAWLMRRGINLISDPVQLKAMQRAIAPSTSETQARALIGRLLEAGLQDVNTPALGS